MSLSTLHQIRHKESLDSTPSNSNFPFNHQISENISSNQNDDFDYESYTVQTIPAHLKHRIRHDHHHHSINPNRFFRLKCWLYSTLFFLGALNFLLYQIGHTHRSSLPAPILKIIDLSPLRSLVGAFFQVEQAAPHSKLHLSLPGLDDRGKAAAADAVSAKGSDAKSADSGNGGGVDEAAESDGQNQPLRNIYMKLKHNSLRKIPATGPEIEVAPLSSLNPNATASACLLLDHDDKDEEDDLVTSLNEWIAYHYHTLNLRTLLVGVSSSPSSSAPTSKEQQQKQEHFAEMLGRWRLMTDLEVWQWTREEYMPPPDVLQELKKRHADDNAAERKGGGRASSFQDDKDGFRQRIFLAECIQSLRKGHHSSWMFYTDSTHDFISVPDNAIGGGMNGASASDSSSGIVFRTVQQYVRQNASGLNYPCIPMETRPLQISTNNNNNKNNNNLSLLDPFKFETLKQHTAFSNGNGAASIAGLPPFRLMLDLEAIPAKFLDDDMVLSVHRPVRAYCPALDDKSLQWQQNQRQQLNLPIFVHRYIKQQKQQQQHVVGEQTDEAEAKLWLRGFVDAFGEKAAAKLLGQMYSTQSSSS